MKGIIERFRIFSSYESVHGIERLFVGAILLLRALSLSYWMRLLLPWPRTSRHRVRDNVVDVYCVFQLALVVDMLAYWPLGKFPIAVGAYILFEVFLVNLNIIFVGKFPQIQAPPASIERTIILLFINVLEVVGVFAIFYTNAGLNPTDAIFSSTLVLGTVGYPELKGSARLIIALQIFLDLTLGLLLLSTVAAHMGFFRRPDLYKHSEPIRSETPLSPEVHPPEN